MNRFDIWGRPIPHFGQEEEHQDVIEGESLTETQFVDEEEEDFSSRPVRRRIRKRSKPSSRRSCGGRQRIKRKRR